MAENNLEESKTLDQLIDDAYDELTAEPEVEEAEIVEEETEETTDEVEGGDPVSTEGESDDDPIVDDTPDDEPSDVTEPDEHPNPPTTWTAEAKSKYSDLPGWAKKEIHKREQDSLNGANNLKEKASFADRLNATIQPYQPLLNSMGVTPENAVKDALNLAHSLKTGSPAEKVGIIKNIAHQYGIDLGQVTQEKPNEIDQHLRPLQQEIQRLRQEQHQSRQMSAQQAQNEANSMVNAFVTETDEKGATKHPYFHNVQADMKVLIESGRATTLEDAYDKACWADPSIRSLLQTQQQSEKEAKRREEEKGRLEKAKKSNRNNLPKKSQPDFHSKPKRTIDQTIDEEFDRLTAEG